MRTVLWASLRHHGRRYLAAAVAIALGSAFVALIGPLSSGMRAGLVAGADDPYAGSTVVVPDTTPEAVPAMQKLAEKRGGRISVLARAYAPVTHDGRLLDARVPLGSVGLTPKTTWQKVVRGRAPTGPGEALVDVNRAKSYDLSVGDSLRVGRGQGAASVRIVGLADTPSAAGSAVAYLTWGALQSLDIPVGVEAVTYAGPGDTATQLAAVESAVPDSGAVTTEAHVAALTKRLSQGVDILVIALLLFAAVALSVAVLVIANTFAIVFAQRSRDFALLRCVGATGTQVRRSVRLEALGLGILAALAGSLLGTLAGFGLVALIRAYSPTAMGSASLGAVWPAAGILVGIVVTVVAAWLPTRRVTRLDPLTALRPDVISGTAGDARLGRGRVALGAAMIVAGLAMLGAAVGFGAKDANLALLVLLVGGASSFFGLLVLGPLVVPWLIARVGVLAGRGPAARLARGNAVRNPRRTATTAASLLIGITLTTAVTTGMATSQHAIDRDLDGQYPVDLSVTVSPGKKLPEGAARRAAEIDGVAKAVAVPGTLATVSGRRLTLLDATGGREVARGETGTPVPRAGEIVVPRDQLPESESDRERVTLRTAHGSATVRVRTADGWGPAALIAPETLRRLDPRPSDRAVWVRAAEGADPEDLQGDVSAALPGGDVNSGLAHRAWVAKQIEVVTYAIVGLLGTALLIALVGIGNTLGLSVRERRREIALLRAVGTTRRQVRRTLLAEAVLLSVAATLLGVAVGVGFGWIGSQVLVGDLVGAAPLRVPWAALATIVATSAAAGVIASLVPGRRATRIAPATALAVE